MGAGKWHGKRKNDCCEQFIISFNPTHTTLLYHHLILHSLFPVLWLLMFIRDIDGRHGHTVLFNRCLLRTFYSWGCRLSKTLVNCTLGASLSQPITVQGNELSNTHGKLCLGIMEERWFCPVWSRSGIAEEGSLPDRDLPAYNRYWYFAYFS